MLAIPPARRETRAWRQRQRAGTRDDRMLREIEVLLPSPIAKLDLAIPTFLAGEIDEAVQAVAALDASQGPVLAALSGLLLRTESVASSKIERITASVDDFTRALHGSRANASAVSMVAASRAMEHLMASASADNGIHLSDVLATHAILMADEPGERVYAGRLRDVQNWVGGSDYSPRGAVLIPPPPDLLDDLVADLMAFVHRTDIPSLLQATIAHAQFETLHPFTDGNGRIGRALINAILRSRGTTSSIVVPIASGLLARRDEYFAALNTYRAGDLEPLALLFAQASYIAASEATVTATRLRDLPAQWLGELGRTRRGSASLRVLECLLINPAISAQDVEQVLAVRSSVAYAAIDRLVDAGILRPLTDRKRHQVWGAAALLDELADLDTRIGNRARRGA